MAGRRRASPPSAAELSGPVRVDWIGADGDGVAAGPGGSALFLACTLPGECVQPGPAIKRGEGFAAAASILEPSPDRVTPPCPHFGPCGGCTLQHWADAPYAAWKAGRAAAAIGLGTLPLARTPPGTRRRMDLGIRRTATAIEIGLHRRRSSDVVDMRACPILHPVLFTLVQALRPVLLRLDGLRRTGEASVNLVDNGPDLLLRTDAPLTARDRSSLAEFARANGVPRISTARIGSVDTEPAAVISRPMLTFSGHAAAIPTGTFLQASQEGERAIVAAVLRMLPEKVKGPIVELYAGSGSLTHAISTRGRVVAYEGDPAAVAAVRSAGNGRVTASVRDLARQPLTAAELEGAGAVVLDPPYNGAVAQMPALAASGVPIVYVSCNPGALTRDSRILLGSGYRVIGAEAVDQFLWSSQVETIVLFRKA
ncbi:MAG: class I SAM-dependent RNA methyltransferase [Acetobacteraceae bacterium]|nr:class I SAM-dependent RNA methyltransferase [Acetobacteraceae bacterium]